MNNDPNLFVIFQVFLILMGLAIGVVLGIDPDGMTGIRKVDKNSVIKLLRGEQSS